MAHTNTATGLTGRLGIDTVVIARTTQWDVSQALASSSEWGDSDSGGFTNRARGRLDATFTAEGKFDNSDDVFLIFQPGDTLDASLWISGTPELYWQFGGDATVSGGALCTDFGLTVNVDTEEVVGWTASFGTDGQFWFPGDTGPPAQPSPVAVYPT